MKIVPFSFTIMKYIEIQPKIASHAILELKLAMMRELYWHGLCHCFMRVQLCLLNSLHH